MILPIYAHGIRVIWQLVFPGEQHFSGVRKEERKVEGKNGTSMP